MQNKKGVEMPFNVIIIGLILVVTAFVVIGWFTGTWSAGAGELKKGTTLSQDHDGDDIINAFDKCPCRPGIDKYDGCLSEADIPKTKESIERENNIINEYCLKPEKDKK